MDSGNRNETGSIGSRSPSSEHKCLIQCVANRKVINRNRTQIAKSEQIEFKMPKFFARKALLTTSNNHCEVHAAQLLNH